MLLYNTARPRALPNEVAEGERTVAIFLIFLFVWLDSAVFAAGSCRYDFQSLEGNVSTALLTPAVIS